MARITKAAINRLPIGGEIWEDGIFYRKGRKGGTWWITYYVGTRQKKERIGKDSKKVTKRKAQEALAARQGEVVQGRFDIAKTERPIPCRDFFKNYIKYAKSNKKDWRQDERRGEKHLLPEFGDLPLSDVTPWKIEKYKSRRVNEGAAKSTVNRELALLKTVFSKAVIWGKAKDNPVKRVKLYRENNRRERFLTEEEAHKIIEAAGDPVKYFIIIGLNTGMRRSEILGLRWPDISLEQKTIILKDDKGGTGRKIPINSYLVQVLKSMPKLDDTYVFPGLKQGKHMVDIRESFRVAVEASKIKNSKNVIPHTLRHTYASWLAMKGVDLFTVQYLMGHKTIAMTQRYSHLCPDHKRQATEQISAVFSNTITPLQPQKEKARETEPLAMPITA
jgi:integrase